MENHGIRGILHDVTDGDRNPTFHERFVFLLMEGLRELNIDVWNSNTLLRDKFISGGRVQLAKVLSCGYDDSSWPLETETGRFVFQTSNAGMHQEECEEHVNVENVVPQTAELESNTKEKPKKTRATHKRSLVWGHYESFLNDQGEQKIDNAKANDVAVAYLKSKFINWEKFVLEGKWLHIRCTTHVMNLIVQDGLSHIGKLVDCVKAAVKYIRQSPQRLAKFKEYAKIEKCPSTKSLIFDVPTRWNSTYLMLDAAQKYERAFDRYDSEDRYYRDDLEKTGVPISSNWENVRSLTKFLEHFYELTLKVSGTLYVTSNSFLDDITSINAAFRGHYCINGVPETNLAAMAKMMKCKFDKYYGSLEKCNMATVVSSVLDPRNKFEYVEVLLGDVYGKIEGKAMCAMIKASLVELYKDYVRIHASPKTHTIFESVDASSSMNKRSATATPVIELSVILKQKSEFDRYLNEDVEDESDKFDILNWWKVNSPRFPVLSLLARDVLAISISMVASEFVFSNGGRVLDAFRSSLTPPVVESLICTQDWFRENSRMLDIAEYLDEIHKIEERISAAMRGSWMGSWSSRRAPGWIFSDSSRLFYFFQPVCHCFTNPLPLVSLFLLTEVKEILSFLHIKDEVAVLVIVQLLLFVGNGKLEVKILDQFDSLFMYFSYDYNCLQSLLLFSL
ncbi:zinc finger BED domain-containing protein RICESLEEPER 2-like protein [Tanacetum coccineum]|uniref:Zinc finger BED domain-containing protein RICESLEEPER 2-like protein n=1 Tax=Tanacetum coccineum TaxID=301880 RepID=A0ABQ5CUQ6_9ASTR